MTSINQIRSSLDSHLNRKINGLIAVTDAYAQRLESQAKSQARWNDRTGNARQGLKGYATRNGDEVIMRLIHQVSYGIYLEKANAGKYAIIKPTMDANKASIERGLKRYWENT